MPVPSLKILPTALLKAYKAAVRKDLRKRFNALRESPLSTKTFSFYTSVSAIASSKIEGEEMEVDSYVRHRMLKVRYLAGLVQKPDDFYAAYSYAQAHRLSRANFLAAHKKLSAHFLPTRARGMLRKIEMVILELKTGRIQYEAARATDVKPLFDTRGRTFKAF
jgi:hypothetical protein